jgi:hypothetical protein
VKCVFGIVFAFLLLSCAPTPAPPTLAPPPNSTSTPAALPTAIDTFYNGPSAYTRQLANRTQAIRLGVSPDFAARPVLPFYGLSLTDPKFAANLFEVITYNHFFRWQEADWAARSPVKYDEFKQRLAGGEDLSYLAMDTRAGGAGAHVARVNPAADLDILLIPRHDGFVTFPGSQSDPGLSIKTTIRADGSVVVRAPLVYAQLIAYKKGDAEIQDIARTSIILALMELGIPPEAIEKNDLKAINAWWETVPEQDLHRYQYSYLRELLTDDQDRSIFHLWDDPAAQK